MARISRNSLGEWEDAVPTFVTLHDLSPDSDVILLVRDAAQRAEVVGAAVEVRRHHGAEPSYRVLASLYEDDVLLRAEYEGRDLTRAIDGCLDLLKQRRDFHRSSICLSS